MKLRIDRAAINRLPPAKREKAKQLLKAYEQAVRQNPLIVYEPHSKQVIFHEGQEQLKAFLGGNRSGKTTAGILDDLVQCVDRDVVPDHLIPYKKFEPPFHCRIVCPSEDIMFGIVHQKLREWCPKGQLLGERFDKAYEKSRGLLHFKNGSFIDFLTYGQELDKFGGTAKHRIHYDEEPPRDIRQEGRMRLLDYKGADEIFTMTPLHGMTWMFDEIWEPWQKHALPDGKVVLVDMDDNPHLDEEQKRKLLQGFSKEELEARKSGKFVHFAGLIYTEFSRSFHVIPERPLPPGMRVYVGIDPGMRHQAAVVWCYLTDEDKMVVFDELTMQGHTVRQVAEKIKIINMRHGQRAEREIAPLHPDWYVIDPSARNIVHQTGRSDQMEFTDSGIITILGQNSVTAGINRVKERLQNERLFVMANCQGLIDQFRKYRWSTPTKTEDDPKEKPVKSDDHLLDALRYVVASRPFSAEQTQSQENLRPLERAMREELRGQRRRSNYNSRFGAVFG